MSNPPIDRQALRLELRRRRQALSESQRRRAAHALCHHLVQTPEFRQAGSLAAYLAVRGEIDLAPTLDVAWQQGKTVCVPLIEGESMRFYRFAPDSPTQSGPFGIRQPRPESRAAVDPSALDLVLLPLVAFDDQGTRLGMGGGYYDRHFAFRHGHPRAAPRLLGVAHAFQQVERLEAEPWDVPLDLIVTDAGRIRPGTTEP